jgi:hypothetical protein
MCDIIDLSENMPHLSISDPENKKIYIVSIASIRRVASGEVSIAEFEDPEMFAKLLAISLMDKIV